MIRLINFLIIMSLVLVPHLNQAVVESDAEERRTKRSILKRGRGLSIRKSFFTSPKFKNIKPTSKHISPPEKLNPIVKSDKVLKDLPNVSTDSAKGSTAMKQSDKKSNNEDSEDHSKGQTKDLPSRTVRVEDEDDDHHSEAQKKFKSTKEISNDHDRHSDQSQKADDDESEDQSSDGSSSSINHQNLHNLNSVGKVLSKLRKTSENDPSISQKSSELRLASDGVEVASENSLPDFQREKQFIRKSA
ncbi:hypothetical protein BY996DRAFT_6848376 [Phakopsora pachyrhizi]|uniref:Uncharacterized protein n=1 Tax=Phakopsora pachyrhizi TaxID=170000 RepID=A0AAV0ANR8_PHAPC|nr:hypothetical protein BY996DRAFT_6848376 [Phakopsora pachyrhizi]CAH7670005.1 hypothetical protein PPACK8108_LOCUS4676 [Phakopsora pachyrhizi]